MYTQNLLDQRKDQILWGYLAGDSFSFSCNLEEEQQKKPEIQLLVK